MCYRSKRTQHEPRRQHPDLSQPREVFLGPVSPPDTRGASTRGKGKPQFPVAQVPERWHCSTLGSPVKIPAAQAALLTH